MIIEYFGKIKGTRYKCIFNEYVKFSLYTSVIGFYTFVSFCYTFDDEGEVGLHNFVWYEMINKMLNFYHRVILSQTVTESLLEKRLYSTIKSIYIQK